MSDRRVVITLATGMWKVGQVIEPYGVLRQQLIERGFAKPYVEPAPVVECAAPVAVFARPDVDEVPSATGAPTETLERSRKKHAR